MTTEEFNKKYQNYLGERHYGLAIDNSEVIKYLDEIVFPNLIKDENFKYYQIKLKFGYVCFYSNINPALGSGIEKDLQKIIDNEKGN